MITDKEKVLSIYPNAVAEPVYHTNGSLIWGIWSASKDVSTTHTLCRYLLGGSTTEDLAWNRAAIGVENLNQLIESVSNS